MCFKLIYFLSMHFTIVYLGITHFKSSYFEFMSLKIYFDFGIATYTSSGGARKGPGEPCPLTFQKFS